MIRWPLIDTQELLQFGETGSFREKVKALLNQQRQTWPLLRKNLEALSKIEEKDFRIGNVSIRVQHNPERIRSTAAKTDGRSIEARPCFLCPQNLMEHQKGILFHDRYLVLANPFPIFPEHLTIPQLSHQPQQINGHFQDMLRLSRELTGFTVFYNGPQCGASAPDHFHFQAGTARQMPVENEYAQLPSQIRSLLISTSEIQINAVDDGLRRYWSLESGNIEKLEFYFEQIYRLLEAREQTEAEPMLNILTTFDKKWNVFIFPRDRQRPDCFFSQGDDQILMSPASVEMGGIAILPRPEDFEKIDTKQLQEIYQQVTMEQSDFRRISQSIL
jgi:hypothetical protein